MKACQGVGTDDRSSSKQRHDEGAEGDGHCVWDLGPDLGRGVNRGIPREQIPRVAKTLDKHQEHETPHPGVIPLGVARHSRRKEALEKGTRSEAIMRSADQLCTDRTGPPNAALSTMRCKLSFAVLGVGL